MGQRSACRPTDVVHDAIDYPRSLLNAAALLSIILCTMSMLMRAALGLDVSAIATYASIVAIETVWFAGQAAIILQRT